MDTVTSAPTLTFTKEEFRPDADERGRSLKPVKAEGKPFGYLEEVRFDAHGRRLLLTFVRPKSKWSAGGKTKNLSVTREMLLSLRADLEAFYRQEDTLPLPLETPVDPFVFMTQVDDDEPDPYEALFMTQVDPFEDF